MRKIFGALLASALVFGGTAAAGATVGGEIAPPTPTLTLSPTSGPADSTFTVSGSDCGGIRRLREASLGIPAPEFGGTSVEVTAPDTVEMTATAMPDDAGDWSVELTVPSDATGDDEITVDATCTESFVVADSGFKGFRAPGGLGFSFNYTTATFTVIAGPTTTEATGTSTTTTSTPSTEPDGAVADSAAAQPVTATPTFTG